MIDFKKIYFFALLLFVSTSYGQILINDTFDAQGDWGLINGSTISGGVLTIVANGSVGSSQDNWSARQDNILNEHYYQTRRFRFTFDARQTSGTGELQLGQRNNTAFDQVITSSWVTYTVEADGNVANSENDIAFGGRNIGDTFEIDNFTMEIIGDTSNPNVPGEPAQVTFYTDFEFSRYGYDQWGAVGSPPAELNQWEVDSGEPRTTDHVDSPLSSGREGTGSAFWLGDYNSPTGFEFNRNEVGRDIALPFGEFWLGGSIFIQDSLPDARIIMQLRNLAPGGTSTVNAISLRQNTSTGQLYFSICDDVNFVDQTEVSLGYWNGAGTNTTSIPVDYNFRGWNDIAIHYKGAFGAAYTGPETSPSPDLETLTSLNEMAGYDMRSDGFIEIWFNGVKVVDHVGTTLYRYEKGGGQIRWGLTPKIGAYWGTPNAAQGNIYYDNWKIWNGPNGSYADVDPSGSGISAGYTVTPTSGLTTTESGGTDTFDVVLDAQPTTDVVFDITSNDTSEGTVSSSSLTFTNANWNTAQTITVTGVDDAIDDGDVAYTVTVSVNAAGSDDDYDALADVTVDLTNTDDDGGAEPSPSTGKRVKKGKFILIDY